MIVKDNRLPLYYQLMDIILDKIERGVLTENDQLPSERELCDAYGVSRTTVRQTLQELEKEGYIYKIHGKGTFVCPKVYNQSLVKFYSFTEEMKKAGIQPTTKVFSFEKVYADSKVAKIMNLPDDEEVFKVARLRLADEEPMIFETSYVPVRRFQNLTSERLEQTPMYEIFLQEYNVIIKKAIESFKAVSARNDEAEMLCIMEGSPCLMLKRITYEQNEVIEYTVSIARGDKFTYSVELN